jgi:glycosyltransferase involved in cell wall biosynthesis
MTIDILMATYNGAMYIDNQILSLLGQTHKNWRLIIHDDGSNDETIAIVQKYKSIDSRITLIDDGIIAGGASKNFLHLLSFSNNELIVFCDQDDIWFENKLETLLNAYQNSEKKDKPLAIFCNGYTYDPNYGILGDKMVVVSPENLKEQLFLNTGIHGCCLLFNKKLLNELQPLPEYVAMHDHLITLGAITFGELIYVNKPLMLYRQNHINKATLNIEYNLIKRFILIFNRKIGVVEKKHFLGSKSFYETYKNKIAKKDQNLFNSYFLYCETTNMFKRIAIVLINKFEIYGSVSKLILKTFLRRRMI